MLYLLASLVGILFGGAVEHVGSLAFGPWGWTTSQLSAPWLLLPFAFGTTERRAPNAAALGMIVSLFGLTGYVLMLSVAAGGAHGPTALVVLHEAGTQARWLLAGAVTGPLYGVLGQRWRVSHWWPSALLAAGALTFEPLTLAVVGRTFGPVGVYFIETAAGLALAAFFVLTGRRQGPATP
ncbi:MAG TPA: hypothetical protein VNM16_07495 [Bacillota bacterium]|nr:hypothetical protein [Bacillota bacterium]